MVEFEKYDSKIKSRNTVDIEELAMEIWHNIYDISKPISGLSLFLEYNEDITTHYLLRAIAVAYINYAAPDYIETLLGVLSKDFYSLIVDR